MDQDQQRDFVEEAAVQAQYEAECEITEADKDRMDLLQDRQCPSCFAAECDDFECERTEHFGCWTCGRNIGEMMFNRYGKCGDCQDAESDAQTAEFVAQTWTDAEAAEVGMVYMDDPSLVDEPGTGETALEILEDAYRRLIAQQERDLNTTSERVDARTAAVWVKSYMDDVR